MRNSGYSNPNSEKSTNNFLSLGREATHKLASKLHVQPDKRFNSKKIKEIQTDHRITNGNAQVLLVDPPSIDYESEKANYTEIITIQHEAQIPNLEPNSLNFIQVYCQMFDLETSLLTLTDALKNGGLLIFSAVSCNDYDFQKGEYLSKNVRLYDQAFKSFYTIEEIYKMVPMNTEIVRYSVIRWSSISYEFKIEKQEGHEKIVFLLKKKN